MRFELPDELEMLRSVVRDWAQSELALGAIERDAHERFDRSVFNQMAELGLTGIPVPEACGGAGVGWLAYVVAIEEVAKVCASSASVLAAHTAGAVWPLFRSGHAASHTEPELVIQLSSGTKLGGASLPNRQWTPLLAMHPSVLNAGAADGYAVFAEHVDADQCKPAVIWVPIDSIEPEAASSALISKLGLRAYPTGAMKLVSNSPITLPPMNIVMQNKSARSMLREVRTLLLLSAAAQSVGIAQGALEAAASYAKTRKQFGIPIGKQQGIMFKLADMSIATEASRLLVHQAAWQLDEGKNTAAAQIQLARTYAARSAAMVAREAVQIHGGYGYIEEFLVERMLRDAMTLETAIGVGGLEPR